MNAPFTAEEFFSAFGAYNAAVWPFQFVLAACAIAVAAAVLRGWVHAGRLALGFLAVLWLWAGVAYHLLQFTCSAATLDEVSRVLRIDDGVMRHMATRRIGTGTDSTVAVGGPRSDDAVVEPVPAPEED